MHPLAVKRVLPRLLPLASHLLVSSVIAFGAAGAHAQLGQNSSTDTSGQGSGGSQGQGTITTTRSGFGSRTSIDYGAGGPINLGNSSYGTIYGQPCSTSPAAQGQANAATTGGSGTNTGTGMANGTNTGTANGATGSNLQPCPTNSLQMQLFQQGQNQPVFLPPYAPGEFELYVQNLEPQVPIRRLGAEMMQGQQVATPDVSPVVPPDYVVKPGDELDIAIWGSVDAQAPVVVDRTGRVTLPRVGSVMVAGTRFEDLPDLLTRHVSTQFRNFKLSVTLGQIRGMRVYVTGFVPRPGSFSVSGLSTVSSALINAGGPTSAGSFRDIEVRRRGQVVGKFDLYELILSGRRDLDIALQPDDVVHVGPVGPQVAILGSVNQPAIVELKDGEDLAAALRMTGGLTSVADGEHITIEPLSDRNQSRVVKVSLKDGGGTHPLDRGDIVNVYSAIDARQPTVRQNKRIVVEGEVAHPGVFVLPANATIPDALALAGGFTTKAYVYGTEFTRESVRLTQQQQYNKLLRDLEVDMQQNITTHLVSSADEAKAQDSRATAATKLVDELRKIQPTGRMVLLMEPSAQSLPPMEIEDGDRIYVPALPTTVGVFGSVFTVGNFVYSHDRRIGDYVAMAGGPKRGADKDSEFVLRANGSVVSNLQDAGWFRSGSLNEMQALPGDTIFMPEELNKMTNLEVSKAWTQIIYQFGLGLAGIAAAIK